MDDVFFWAADRIREVVYLDAFVPSDGETLVQLVGPAGAPLFDVPDWRVPVPPPPLGDFGVIDPTDLAWLRSQMRPHPLGTFREGVSLKTPLEQLPFGRTYILASGEISPAFVATAEHLRTLPAWRVTDLPTGHDMMLTMPNELTEKLLALA